MSEFDSYAHDYESALERGIAVSGENAQFFAECRIQKLSECLMKQDFSARNVLDFGCGTGNATSYFFSWLNVQSVLGLELSSKSLEVARRQHTTKQAVYRLTEEHTSDGSLDLAFCNGVFHYIPLAERQNTIDSIATGLRVGGVFALWENNPYSPGARYVMSQIPFDRDAIMVWPRQARKLMRAAGFRVLRTDYTFIFPHFMSLLRPSEVVFQKVPLGAQYQVLAQKL